ncbi:MAG: ABC-F family ATP-binding cassette domain-containing protein [Desulfobulbaceae bacterium]|nr:ABC-F family ATP-binding cassette domain-containing protein [Desulfobulbaceae bacterium]
MLNCQGLSKTIGSRSLFDSFSFTLNKGDRLGIIGANGTGKTTLLRILAGLDSSDSGKITLTKNIRIGYLGQREVFDDESAADVLYKNLRKVEPDPTEQKNRVHAILSRAEFSDPDSPVRILSGGWQKRLSVCRSLVVRPDILLMDEPTNHLDLEGILWLEKLLESSYPESPSAYILVSHDRLFLENLANRMLEISPVYPDGFFSVDGNYSTFLQRKEEFLGQQDELEARIANRARRESEWLQRGPKARTTKAKYRVDEAHRLHEELAQIKKRNRAKQTVKIDFNATDRKTKKLLEAQGLAKSFAGRRLFTDLDLVLSPGKRLGLLGPNGCGKSTLMKILAGAGNEDGLQPDQGDIKVAEGVKIVSFTQNREKLDLSATLRQALAPEGDTIIYRGRALHLVTWARKFLFTTEQLDTPVGNLSGGEQAKILIADLMRQPADILLLDEPTNDLDIPSLQVLEESLLEFPGAVVLVTHDRFLMNRVCDSVLGFGAKGRVTFFSDYEQWYSTLKKDEKKTGKTLQPNKETKKEKKQRGRLSYMDQREYDGMEENILRAEEEEQELLQFMDDPATATDPEKLSECWAKLENIRRTIQEMYTRWDELEAKKEEGAE